jgi:diadenosine tetraphosphate (Ap4A) HIT family hydrolase
MNCKLCTPDQVIFQSDLAYVRFESAPLTPGHVLVVPRRHVADFFGMTRFEQAAVLALLNRAHGFIQEQHSPERFDIEVKSGTHTHVHLIPRYK